MTKYILNKKIKNKKSNEVNNLKGIDEAAWNFISAIYELEWDSLIADNNNVPFRSKVSAKFTLKINGVNTNKNKSSKSTDKLTTINKISPIPAKSLKKVNEIAKYFKKNKQSRRKNNQKTLYAQALTPVNNTREVLKIKEMFPNLQVKKIEKIQKIIDAEYKSKLRLHIITKGLSRKQVIVPMSNDNKTKFMIDSSAHIVNINRTLKNIKSGVKADFIWTDQSELVMVTNKVAGLLNFQTIKQYIKNANQIEIDNVEAPCLLQSKSYLKIIGILYWLKNTNTPIIADVVETIIKNNHIFNNITIVLRPRVIKMSPKLDMAIIWLNIWDIQSRSKAKRLINRCFNIGSYITTI